MTRARDAVARAERQVITNALWWHETYAKYVVAGFNPTETSLAAAVTLLLSERRSAARRGRGKTKGKKGRKG